MNKRWLKRTDFILIAAVGIILLLSLIIIGSATHVNEVASGQRFAFVERQGFFAILNIALAAFFPKSVRSVPLRENVFICRI